MDSITRAIDFRRLHSPPSTVPSAARAERNASPIHHATGSIRCPHRRPPAPSAAHAERKVSRRHPPPVPRLSSPPSAANPHTIRRIDSFATHSLVPLEVSRFDEKVVQISAGNHHSSAVTDRRPTRTVFGDISNIIGGDDEERKRGIESNANIAGLLSRAIAFASLSCFCFCSASSPAACQAPHSLVANAVAHPDTDLVGALVVATSEPIYSCFDHFFVNQEKDFELVLPLPEKFIVHRHQASLDYEDILLPKDEVWPFLLRFPIGCFGVCLGLGIQAILWGALSASPAMRFLHVTPMINVAMWLLALTMLVAVSVTYALKCVFYFEAIRRDYFHPVRVNFFFAPSIAAMFLTSACRTPWCWRGCTWPSGACSSRRCSRSSSRSTGSGSSAASGRLCKVAKPSSHLSVVGNFVGAILAARVRWVEADKFLWAIGVAHYIVVFALLEKTTLVPVRNPQ